MKNDSLRAKIINRNKGVTSLRDYAEGWNFRLKLLLAECRMVFRIFDGLGKKLNLTPYAFT